MPHWKTMLWIAGISLAVLYARNHFTAVQKITG